MGRVIVVGGGAAGMIAAVAAADRGNSVYLIEKNEKLGKKLFITGKGRCNVTNAGDMDTLFANVRINGKFLYSAFYEYDNLAIMDFLEQAGCPLKTERGERVFPRSDHSSDVIGAFQRELKKRGVQVLLNAEVRELILEQRDSGEMRQETGSARQETGRGREEANKAGEDGKTERNPTRTALQRRIAGVRLSDGRELWADSCIVCTGGLSYPATGSTGDGYRFAEETGHRVTERVPGLVPFRIRENWCSRLMGLSLRNVSLRMVCGGREVYQGFGEMLFTHFGVSGPLILSASSFFGQCGKGKAGRGEKGESQTVLYLDLKPALEPEQLDRRLLRDFEENKNRQFKNALGGLFPARLIPVMTELSGIHPDKKVNEITREERRAFGELMKNLPMTVTGLRGFEEAIITRGGIDVKEINPSTMESKKVRGLYFAGEVLDLDALTGGFNLQIAWSTGHLAGSSV
ncbi:MAG: NAD(P)/FAD-dependent oxidoreductase [Lachnospiraceae bacterium]|nr:NAD(P)/FAD-dependent oxidoreductase [Lachnospiraceae bacterium]